MLNPVLIYLLRFVSEIFEHYNLDKAGPKYGR